MGMVFRIIHYNSKVDYLVRVSSHAWKISILHMKVEFGFLLVSP